MKVEILNRDGVQISDEAIGLRWYCNSTSGRHWLAAECPPELVAEVLAVWGDTPAMPDYEPQDEPPPEPTAVQQMAALKAQLIATDYQAIKYAEGWLSGEDYAPIRAQRQEWRDEINRLELLLK